MLKLSALARNIQKHHRPISSSIVGVVTDVTRPLFRQKQGNYIVMIKVVDESLNDEQVFGVMSKDCTVYLISKNKKDVDFIKSIGEIVLLDKFTFALWNDIKLETKYLYTTEGIYIITIDPNSNKLVTKQRLAVSPELFQTSENLQNRVSFLMEWRSTCLSKIYEPKLGVSILNSHCVMIEPFNMILRFQAKSQEPQDKSTSIILKDINNNTYKIKYSEGEYEQGDLVLVRGIGSIGQSLELMLTETGNILRFAYQVDQNLMNYMAIYRDNQKFVAERKENQFTTVQSENKEITYLSDLITLQDKYDSSNKKEDIDIRDNYLVNVIAINYEGFLSMFHREYQILLHDEFYEELSQDQKKEYKQFNRIGYVYEGVLGLLDRSNQVKGKLFYVNLFTNDASGNFIGLEQFSKAEAAIATPLQNTLRKQLLQSINKKLKKLTQQSSFIRPVSLLLEPIRSQKLLFRVINTRIY